MASYAQALTPLIRTILQTSDLSTISAKGVRKNLISRGQDEATIKANRSEIDEIISGLYDQMTAQAPATPPREESKPRVNATPSGSGSQSAHPQSSLPRPLNTKPKIKREVQSKAEIEDSGSEVEGDMDDEAYARQLQTEFNALQSERPSRGSRPKPKTKKKVVKRKVRSEATVDGDGSGEDGPKKKRAAPNTAFNKDMILSDALSTLVGEARLSRPQTVKRIWDYVKERDLQDPADKRYIVCADDEKLKAVFHTDRLHMFTMNKILSKHFMDPEDVVVKKDEPEAL